jgi:hypothetical protein
MVRVWGGGHRVGGIIGASWMCTLAFGHNEDRTPPYGYAEAREAAMAAFARSWRRERLQIDVARGADHRGGVAGAGRKKNGRTIQMKDAQTYVEEIVVPTIRESRENQHLGGEHFSRDGTARSR